MEQYYKQLATNGHAEKFLPNKEKWVIAIFTVGDYDVDRFPELLTVYQIWVFSSGNVRTIDMRTVARCKQHWIFGGKKIN